MDIICAKTGLHFSSTEALQECQEHCRNGECPHEKGYVAWLFSQYEKEREKKIAAKYEAFLKSRQQYQLSEEEKTKLNNLLKPPKELSKSSNQIPINETKPNMPDDTRFSEAISELIDKENPKINKDENPKDIPQIQIEMWDKQKKELDTRKENYKSGVIKLKPYKKKKTHYWKIGIAIVLAIFIIGIVVIGYISNNTNNIAHTPLPTPSPTPLTKPEYINFHNELGGYSIDYPSAWTVTSANGSHTLFTDSNKDIMIDLMQENTSYHSEILNFNYPGSEINFNIQNSVIASVTYTLLSKTEGSRLKYTYLCNFNPLVLLVECNYPDQDTANKNFDRLNASILHMIPTYSNPYVNTAAKRPEPTHLALATTPVLSSTPPIQNTPTISSKPTVVSTPTTRNTPTISATQINLKINSTTGTYNNYYLGLVHELSGYNSGAGCYDNTGDFIILINNKNATNPTYNQLVSFLQKDKTDTYPYQYVISTASSFYGTAESHVNLNRIQNIIDGAIQPDPPKKCGDFAERLHNNAEMAGIKCAYVSIGLSGYTDPYHYGIPSNSGHALNAFQTTDKGLVYIDDTNSPGPPRCVSTVDLQVGKEYIPEDVFPSPGWSGTWDSMGIVTNVFTTWDGEWGK
jgi:hypothetical protein